MKKSTDITKDDVRQWVKDLDKAGVKPRETKIFCFGTFNKETGEVHSAAVELFNKALLQRAMEDINEPPLKKVKRFNPNKKYHK